MFLVHLDEARRLLTIRFWGRVDAAQVRACTEQLHTVLADVAPGWRLLSDLSDLESMEFDCIPFVRESMKLCNAKGVAAVVRVIPDMHKDIGYGLLTIFHYDARVRVSVCETLEQAQGWLADG